MSLLSQAPTCEIVYVEENKDFKPPKNLYYDVIFGTSDGTEKKNKRDTYEPQKGDVIALTDIRPKCIDDLIRPPRNYLLAYVSRGDDEESLSLPEILAAKPIFEEENYDEDGQKKRKPFKLYATFLINITTNLRICTALLGGKNYSIIKEVLSTDSNAGDRCDDCSSQDAIGRDIHKDVQSLKLNDSQNNAVISSVETSQCNHKSSVKLIWGPPGTGKTKTVATFLWVLLKMKSCRTVTCAPTNIAVVGVASRFYKLVEESIEQDGYGLGDIVLFGNEERMKIDDHEELSNIFLKDRVDRLAECFVPVTGWRHQLNSMISLLEDPTPQYNMYLKDLEKKQMEKESGDQKKKNEAQGKIGKKKNKDQAHRGKKKKAEKRRERKRKKGDGLVGTMILEGEGESYDTALPLWEFTRKRFDCIIWNLKYCVQIFCIHLSTSYLSKENVGRMKKSLTLLQSIGTSLCHGNFSNNELEKIFASSEDFDQARSRSSKSSSLRNRIQECRAVLEFLRKEFTLPNFFFKPLIGEFCLEHARLIFCTASSSAKLNEGKNPVDLLVIDEAAQLKECESAIPLQLPWVRHAILIGDERQLPAMIKSKVRVCIIQFFLVIVSLFIYTIFLHS
ncbi:hypothetical protein ACHQM5_006719 [Ranunculus cassubicifolius]